jgi:hypothetical protein
VIPALRFAACGLRLLPKKISRAFIHPLCASLILPPSLPARGRCLDRLGRVGRERRPRRSGPARLSRLSGKRTRSSRGSPPPPLRHYDRSAQWGLKKRGMETFRRRVGAPVRRDFTMQRQAGAPSPLVPSRMSRPGGGWRVGGSQTGRLRKFLTSPFTTHHSPASKAGIAVASHPDFATAPSLILSQHEDECPGILSFDGLRTRSELDFPPGLAKHGGRSA